MQYTYTPDLWLKSVTISGRSPITYDYDGDGLVTRGGALTLTRDPLTGAITGDTLGVVATSRTYDDHGALSGIELRVKGLVTWSQRMTRDSIGRITVQRDSDATTGVVVTGYRYDAQDRLDQVTKNGVAAQAFTFDAAGNRTAVTTSAGIVAATYAADDRVLSYDGQAITHDASGARVSEVRGADTLGYQYDDLGRLTQLASTTAGTLTFKYDAQGRRVQELLNGVVNRGFLYANHQAPIAELTAQGTIKSEFVYVTGSAAPDYILQSGRTQYLSTDHRGSVRKAVDIATGLVTQVSEYDANGMATRDSNSDVQPFGYSGGLRDVSDRTTHFGARDYDAHTGLWIQPDPLGARGGRGRYEYANGDPTNKFDLSGLSVCSELRAAMEAVAEGIAKRFADNADFHSRGKATKTHGGQIEEQQDRIKNLKNRYYRQNKCDQGDDKDDHDDWMNGNGAIVDIMQTMPLPPWDIDNTDNPHGPGRKRPNKFSDLSCPAMTPMAAAGWGLLGAAFLQYLVSDVLLIVK